MNDEIKALYAAFLQGRTIRGKYKYSQMAGWFDYSTKENVPLGNPDYYWEVKPSTRTVTIELPEAVKEPLKYGEWYCSMQIEYGAIQSSWRDDFVDLERLKQGRIFRTEAEANAARDALLKALRGE